MRAFDLSHRHVLSAVLFVAFAGTATAQLGPPPVPPENPITEPKRVLGKILFWDEQLSSDDTMACGTCHIPSAGGSDPRMDMGSRHPGLDGVFGGEDDRFASGGVHLADSNGAFQPDPTFGFAPQVTGRRANSMIGSAFFTELFWDGRATSTFVDPETGQVSIPSGGALESQAVGPILSSVEMADEGRTWDDVRDKLARVRPLALASNLNPDVATAISMSPTYPSLFAAAFGDSAITAERIAYAIATYQRTLHPDETPWDLFRQGQTNALNSQERSGLNSFTSASLRCTECHQLPLFSDGSYRNLGLRHIDEDEGRRAVTGLHSDRGKFKVPSLRNVGLRPAYFHNGDPTFNSLFLAVFFYNQGGGFFTDNKDPLLSSIFMAPSTAVDITAFLQNGLTDPRAANEVPPFDRPTLRSELGPVATLVGSGRTGSGGFEPKINATVPAKYGSESFRVGVNEALGGAQAVLVTRDSAPGPGTPSAGTVLGAGSPSRILHRTVLDGVGAGAGYATWSGDIPDDMSLVGSEMWFRWFVRDNGANGSRAATPWAQLTVE